MYPTVKARESVRRHTTLAPESSLPTKDTWLLNKEDYRRLSNELNYKTKIFCFVMTVFIHGICMCEGVSEGSEYWHDM